MVQDRVSNKSIVKSSSEKNWIELIIFGKNITKNNLKKSFPTSLHLWNRPYDIKGDEKEK